jgi:membrane-associated protein
VPGGPERARSILRERGALAVLLGRFVVFVRAVMPAAAGAVGVRYRAFVIYDVIGAVIWGVGYCLVGFLAGSAYSAVESKIGTALAIAVAAVVVAGLAVWSVRRHRAAARAMAGEESTPGGDRDQSDGPGDAEPGGHGGLGARRRGD